MFRLARWVGLAMLLAQFGWGASFAGGQPGDTAESGEAGYRNTLRWTTASEVDNFGFDVFRAKAEDGPFQRVNEDPIPGAGTSDVPSNYAWVDERIEAGQAYFYYVESISMAGVRERATPTFRAPPKGPEAKRDDGSRAD